MSASAAIRSGRRFVLQSGLMVAAAGLITASRAEGVVDKTEEALGLKPPEVTPPEDLMREHGVLDRVLLIYEAAMRKLQAHEDFDPKVISDSAKVVQAFIENYHEKSEEDFIFPRFRKAGQLVDLVETLLQQHRAGRRVTAKLIGLAPQSRSDGDAERQTLEAISAFVRMYRPHAAREDTDLFPKLRAIVSAHEFDAIGEEMEKQEHRHFGEDGFEKTVAEVARIERAIGIADLRQFTPPA